MGILRACRDDRDPRRGWRGMDLDMDDAELEAWLEELRTEHRDLDDLIRLLTESRHPDLMQVQRLKKRKLRLKDMIARLESKLIPDLDA
jgi:hypothetical protein